MDEKNFKELLIKTAFCCMASDGHIDNREVELIKSVCSQSPLFCDFNFQDEVNFLISEINSRGKQFILNYLDLLLSTELDEQEELTLIDFALKTIKADEDINYSEIKFFKNIRYRLKLSDETILKSYPDIEMFLEKDIVTDSFIDKITNQYLDESELPKFNLLNIDSNLLDNIDKD